MIEIRDPRPQDEMEWRRLWGAYNRFYDAEVPAEVTAGTWRRLLDPTAGLFARLAVREGRIVGFATALLHPGTWSLDPLCYLEDLFVAPEDRGGGVGHALIADLIGLGRSCGWTRLYWHTRADNDAARRLYDRFTPADGFVRYTLALG